MSKIIDVVLRLKDNMTKPLSAASKGLQAHAREFQKAGRQIQRTGRTVTNVGKGLTRSITLPIAGVAAVASKYALEFEKNMAEVNTLLDDTSHLESYTKTVKSVSNELAIDSEVSAKGMYQTISTLGDHGKVTEEIFTTMAGAAKAGGAEVIDSVNMIATAMNGYGDVSNETAQRLSDLAFQTVKLGKTTFPEMAQSMSPLFPLGKNLGITYEELYATMSTATTSFAGNTAEAVTQIKGLMSGFLKPSDDMKKFYEEIGVKSGAALIKQKGLAGALELVQKHAGKDGLQNYFKNIRGMTAAMGLSGSGLEKFKKHLKEMEKATGSTNEALQKVEETNAFKIDQAKTRIKNSLETLGGAILPKIVPLIEKASDAIVKAFDKFDSMSDEQKDHLLKIIGLIALLPPAITVIGKLTTGIGGVVKGLGALGKAGGLISALTSPAGIVLGIIVAIGAAVAFVIAHWDKLKDSAMRCWEAIKPIVQTAKDTFEGLFGDIGTWAKQASDILVEAFKVAFGIIEQIIKWITPVVQAAIKAIGKVVKKVQEVVSKIYEKCKKFYEDHKELIDGIVTVVGGAIDILMKLVGNFASWFGDTFGTVFETVGDLIGGIVDALSGVIDFLTGVFTLDWEKAWEGIKEIFTGIWEGIWSILKGIINLIIGAINMLIKGVNAITGWIPWLFGGDYDWIPEIPTLAKGTDNWKGGIVQISERGGEIVDLPSGSRVYPHDESVQRAFRDGQQSTMSNSVSINIPKLADKIVVREDADIDRIAARLAHKLEKTSLNLGASQIGYQYQS